MSPSRRGLWLATYASAALVVCPAGADAQQHIVIDAAFQLAEEVQGTFGDEGVRIGPALERMAGGLAEWDRTIRADEDRVAAELPRASARERTSLHLMLARTHAERGRFADAMRELDAVSNDEPRRPDVLSLRALVLAVSLRRSEADEAHRTAWLIEPTDPVKAYYVGRPAAGARSQADVERARAILTDAYRRVRTDPVRQSVPPFPRLSLLDQETTVTPVVPLARYALAFEKLAASDYDGALAEFRRATAGDSLLTDPAARSVPIMRAASALRAGRLAEARALIPDANVPRQSSEAHRIFGLIYWASAEYDASIEQFTIAIDRNSRDERARLALARVLSARGRDTDARRVLLDTIQAFPDSALAHWWLGLDYGRLNQSVDARRELETAAATAIAGRNSLYIAAGRLVGGAADPAAAIESFMRAVDANPNDPVAHRYLAGALRQQDRGGDALIEFMAAVLIDSRDAEAHAGIGQVYLDSGAYAAAIEALRRAVDLAPDHTEARYALATALMRAGRAQDAEQEFGRVQDAQRTALAERRRDMSLAVLKEEAALRAAEGRYDAAIALYERAATLGRDPAVYQTLSDLYRTLGRLDDAARAHAMSEQVAP